MRRVIRLLLAAALVLGGAGAGEARDYFGAIAYSRTTKLNAYANEMETQAEAEAAALTACSDLASDCESVMWFRNACGALAVGKDGWGSDWGVDQQTAEGKALTACRKYSGDCTIVRWVCTTR